MGASSLRVGLKLDKASGSVYTRYTSMATRKRAPKPDVEEVVETPEERVPVVTEVVEEVPSEAVADATPIEDLPEETVSDPVPEPEPETDVKPKDVVEGLFRKDIPPVTPEITIHKENKRLPLLLWIAIVVVVAVAVGGGLIWATGSASSLGFLSRPKPTPTPTAAPTPTPAPAVSREDITIEVLNGGGTPGAAGRMQSFLEEKGYTVASTGNTEEYTYETTEILVKPEKEAYLAILQEDLQGDYTLGTVSATLEEDASSDVRIIVGEGE